MATEEDINGTSTTNIRMDGGKKNRNWKKHQMGSQKVMDDSTPSEVLTSQQPSTVEASDDELVKMP